MRRLGVALAIGATSTYLAACAVLVGIEDRFFEGDSGPPPVGDAAADGDARGAPEAGCPEKMVSAGTFCIDATEVTQRAYQAFLEQTKDDAGRQIAACSGNTTFKATDTCKPFTFDPSSNRPMVCIDWCDAWAYCAWAGKRLCGNVRGGGVTVTETALWSTSDQWYAACSKQADDTHAFPYGPAYEAGVCNDRDYDAGAPVDVGSIKECVGGYPDLFDMSGNVWEWEDACNTVDGGDTCVARGGSHTAGSGFFPYLYLSCKAHYDWNARSSASADIGFRCCSP